MMPLLGDMPNPMAVAPEWHAPRWAPARRSTTAKLALTIAAVAVLLVVVAQFSVLAAGILYAMLVMRVAVIRPAWALVLIFALAPFQNDLSLGGPVKFSIAEINLVLVTPIFLLTQFRRGKSIRLGPVFLPVALYLTICTFSTAMHWSSTAFVALLQIFLYLVCAVTLFANFLPEPRKLLQPIQCAVVVAAFVGLMEVVTNTHFMGLNKNGWGSSVGTATVIAIELWMAETNPKRKRLLTWVLPVLVGALLFSLSRGAWIGAFAGVAVVVLLRRRVALFARLVLMMVPIIAIVWFLLPRESREYATGFDGDRYNILMRYQSIEKAKSAFYSNPVWGVGVGLRKEMDATNLVLVTLAETGVPGLLAFLLIHGVVLRMVWVTQKQVDRNDPLYSLLVLGAALPTAQFVHGLVDHYWTRGAIMQAWGAAGMAMAVYFYLRRNRAAAAGAPI